MPLVQKFNNGITVLNDGSWVDTGTMNQNLNRTFAVITTGETDSYNLYQYKDDGSLARVTAQLTLPAAN